MAIIATVSFSKKIPVPDSEYSSQGYSLSLQTEIPESDAAEIRRRLSATYELVRTQVEHELQSNGGGAPNGETFERRREAGGTSPNSAPKASNRQIKYITDLWTQGGGSVSDLNARIREEFGVDGLFDLDKRQASQWLDQQKRESKKAA